MAGQKRKRDTEPADDATLQRKVSGKLHHSFKEAAQAAKKAKAFEVQRTVKKLKEARQKAPGDVLGLEKKLESAKTLDHAALARISLSRKIHKIKTLAENPMIQVALAEVEVPSFDSITGETKQAVLSSKILAGEVGRLCTALKELVEPTETETPGLNEESEEEGEKVEEEEWKGVQSNGEVEGDDEAPDPAALESALSKLGIPLDSISNDPPLQSDSSETDSVVLDDGEDSEEVDDGASWESGSVDSDGNVRRAVSVSSSGSSSPPKKQPKTSNKTESRFLPSLAAGFIRGDSDGSDIEDADAAPERKNRRGQRARKAIWEKKYGKNANHVKKAREESAARGRGRGRGRGGFSAGPGRGGYSTTEGRAGGPGTSRGGAPAGRGGRVRPPPAPLPTTRDSGWQQRPAKKEDDKPMHPSWIAKQKLKSKESIGAAPKGKKIVFD